MTTTVFNEKFQDKWTTAKGEQRAWVNLTGLKTLWFNTGTRCNLECAHCYIESSPQNDRLAYLTSAEVQGYLGDLAKLHPECEEIGFTGGEPLINPEIIDILEQSLATGLRVLVLTNAFNVIGRHKKSLLDLKQKYGKRLTLRVSLDHYSDKFHDAERSTGSFQNSMKGLAWLNDNGFSIAVAGRTMWHESHQQTVAGFHKLFKQWNINLDAENPHDLVLFPEMDEKVDVPEITTQCWKILDKSPDSIMCATSRMVVKPKGKKPQIQACTLIAYDDAFCTGETLRDNQKSVYLNHPHCAKFCVLGGASCSV